MKKLTFAAIALLLVAMLGTSCSKVQTTTAEPGSATITLHLGINTDVTNDTAYNGASETQYEKVPAGTIVHFVYDTKDLQHHVDTNYTYEKMTITGTVDANSNVMVTIPSIYKALSVDVKYPNLELDETYTRIRMPITFPVVYEKVTRKTIYSKATHAIGVWDGAIIVQEQNY
jgi:hypothetical protein